MNWPRRFNNEYSRTELPDLAEEAFEFLYNQSVGGLLQRIKESPPYGDKFLTTLEINKIESADRAFKSPRRFNKTFDDLSVVQSYTANDSSKVKDRFSQRHLLNVLEYLTTNTQDAFTHFHSSATENILSCRFPKFPENYVIKDLGEFGLIKEARVHPKLAPYIESLNSGDLDQKVEDALKRMKSRN